MSIINKFYTEKTEPHDMYLPRFNLYSSVFVKGKKYAPTYNEIKFSFTNIGIIPLILSSMEDKVHIGCVQGTFQHTIRLTTLIY